MTLTQHHNPWCSGFLELLLAFVWLNPQQPLSSQLDLLQILSIIVLPLILSVVALVVELGNNLGDKKSRIIEYSSALKQQGLTHIIETNQEFINKHYKEVVYAGHIILKKFQEAPIIRGFHVGTKEQLRQLTHRQALLKKLHLLPKSFMNRKE